MCLTSVFQNSCSTECQLYHASNLSKRSLQKFLVYAILQPGHPDHLLLEGANNRNVNISHRFLAAPVQANRLANQLYISIVSTRLNIRASYQSAYSGLRFLGEIPAGVMILSMLACSRLRDGGGKSFSNKKCEKRAGVSPFLAWGDFHARSRFARSAILEEKWGTTRSLYTI